MKYCMSCGNQLPDVANFCNVCGSRQAAMGGPAAGQAPAPQARSEATYEALRQFAYSTSGLDLSSEQSRAWAGRWASSASAAGADVFVADLKKLQQYAYSTSGLDLSKQQSTAWAEQWIERVPRGDADRFITRFKELQHHAWSPSGLDLSKQESLIWAAQRIEAEFSAASSFPQQPLMQPNTPPSPRRASDFDLDEESVERIKAVLLDLILTGYRNGEISNEDGKRIGAMIIDHFNRTSSAVDTAALLQKLASQWLVFRELANELSVVL